MSHSVTSSVLGKGFPAHPAWGRAGPAGAAQLPPALEGCFFLHCGASHPSPFRRLSPRSCAGWLGEPASPALGPRPSGSHSLPRRSERGPLALEGPLHTLTVHSLHRCPVERSRARQVSWLSLPAGPSKARSGRSRSTRTGPGVPSPRVCPGPRPQPLRVPSPSVPLGLAGSLQPSL